MEDSIAKQKEAVRKQAGPPPADGFFTTAWLDPPRVSPPLPPCDPLPEDEAAPLIAKAATQAQVDPIVLRELIRQESGFLPCAVSAKGALGLTQIMPETAARLHVGDAFDAGQSIDAGARYLKEMLDRFAGDLKLALAAYNAGAEAVEKTKPAIPDIPETRDYVNAILKAVQAAKPKPPAGVP